MPGDVTPPPKAPANDNAKSAGGDASKGAPAADAKIGKTVNDGNKGSGDGSKGSGDASKNGEGKGATRDTGTGIPRDADNASTTKQSDQPSNAERAADNANRARENSAAAQQNTQTADQWATGAASNAKLADQKARLAADNAQLNTALGKEDAGAATAARQAAQTNAQSALDRSAYASAMASSAKSAEADVVGRQAKLQTDSEKSGITRAQLDADRARLDQDRAGLAADRAHVEAQFGQVNADQSALRNDVQKLAGENAALRAEQAQQAAAASRAGQDQKPPGSESALRLRNFPPDRQESTTPKTRELAEAHINKDSNETVLGKHIGNSPQSYEVEAQLRVASYYNLPKADWDKLTPGERIAANRHFLDKVAEKGDNITLTTPLSKIQTGSFLEDEVLYLTLKPENGGKGYVIVDDYHLRPPDRS